MVGPIEVNDMRAFMEALGLREEPMGMHYADQEPSEGFYPKSRKLPTFDEEAKGRINWGAVFENFSCVIGILWRARKKGTAAYFSKEQFGCLGGAFYLGFVPRQLNFIAHFVSTGVPNRFEGERYLESPEVTRTFFNTINPRPAPGRFCVFKPVSQFSAGEKPELITFFARSEIICGLHQLATFVTNDFEAVSSPFGPGCASILTWPLHLISQGKLKAVLGGWDPSDRRYLKTDELTFTVPLELCQRMLARWRESFLTSKTWATVQKKIEKSHRVWGEE